jgi:hypothetical protein
MFRDAAVDTEYAESRFGQPRNCDKTVTIDSLPSADARS